MSWQTITKEKGLDVSVIAYTELSERIDAEYYKPIFLVSNALIENKKSKKLSELADVKGGKRLPKGEVFSDEGISYIRAEDVKNGFVEYESAPKISLELHQKLKSYQTKYDDVLITIVGNSIGDVGIVKFDLKKCNLTENCAKLVNLKEINADYLFSFLLSKYGQHQIEREKVGTSQPKLALIRIRDFNVPVPSQELQRQLGVLVAKAKEAKDASVKAYSEAEQMLLKEINLEGFKGTEEAISVRNFSEALADNRFDAEYWQPDYDVIQNAIKKHKDGYDTFDNLFDISDKKIVIDPEKAYLYAELADVNGAMGTIDNFTELQGKDLPSRGRMSLKRDDVVMSSLDGSLSKIALITSNEKNIIGSTGFFVLRRKEYEPEVALVLLKSKPIQTLLERQGQGTILSAIPKSSLSRVMLPKLSPTIQKKIKELVLTAHKQKEEAKERLEKAKRAVEIFVEKDEKEALAFINN